jgi:CHAD domain-containing protein
MTPATPDPVAAPAPEAVRAYALKLIRRTTRACKRLGDSDDSEALHDFRVGLRRLRSHLRAYRPFHAVGRKAERRLGSLARQTNPARDAEVALAWLTARRAQLEAHEAAGADRLAQRLAAAGTPPSADAGADVAAEAQMEAQVEAQMEAGEAWGPLAKDLTQRLARDPAGAGADTPYGTAAAACLRGQAERLRAELAEVADITDQEEAHQARIAAKRLRYLLEPLVGVVDGTNAATKALTALQDILGEMHDMDVVIGHLGEILRQTAAERADRLVADAVAGTAPAGNPPGDPEPGLLKLAVLAARERADRFERLRASCLVDGGARLLTPVEGICAALDKRAGG